ncbi:MAG: hypothetical protein RML12_10155 [Xanthomonadales bacterium]|nr:hypothetical protein [Xanthomonadales bacterium]
MRTIALGELGRIDSAGVVLLAELAARLGLDPRRPPLEDAGPGARGLGGAPARRLRAALGAPAGGAAARSCLLDPRARRAARPWPCCGRRGKSSASSA